jgi:hypothetical protein
MIALNPSSMEKLLGGEQVCHYHSKMIMKDRWSAVPGCTRTTVAVPKRVLFPMGSARIAVDRATRENGCLQVIRGSRGPP